MKRMMILTLTATLCAAFLCMPAAGTSEQPALQELPLSVWGTATHQKDGSLLLHLPFSETAENELVIHPGTAPVIHAVTGLAMSLSEVRDGDTVYAWVGPAMTMSLPPQTAAVVLVAAIPADFAVPQYDKIEKSTLTTDRTELTTVGGEVLQVPISAEIMPYRTKNIVTREDLTAGAQILAWRDGEGAINRVLLLFPAPPHTLTWTESGAVTLDGVLLPAPGKSVNGGMYLPLRAVAEAAGYRVAWEREHGAVVSVGQRTPETMLLSVRPGEKTAFVQEGTVPLSGPCLLEKGVTYLPAADLTRLLGWDESWGKIT